MIAIRLVRSKLRKREDHANDEVHPEQPAVVQTAVAESAIIATTTASQTVFATSQDIRNNGIVNPAANCITSTEMTNGGTIITEMNSDKLTWQFPPPYPPPHTPPPQYTLYNDQVNNQ